MKIDDDRIIDKYGRVSFNEDGLIETFFIDKFSNKLIANTENDILQYEDIHKFNSLKQEYIDNKLEYQKELSITLDEFDQIHQEWIIPSEYKEIDIDHYFLDKIDNDKERDRIIFELSIYKKHNLYDLLRLMIYIKSVFDKNKILIGVGRGSSVASYVLYKIGIHKIDSLKYDIDFKEFLE